MKKLLLVFISFVGFIDSAFSASQYPNVTGSVLLQVEADRVLSSTTQGVSPNNTYFYSEPKMSINLNRNWSVKTEWRLQQNNVLTTRDQERPERYRTFFSQDRGVGFSQSALLIEQLKANYQNEDMEFSIGKFDPTFGTAHNKGKRIGVFTSQFTEDYNLREKIGASLTALLESSKFTINSFVNDTTALSKSALNNRGKATSSKSIAGNGGIFSSYSMSLEGHDPFGIKNWNYNIGYRNLGVGNMPQTARESAYVLGSEYLFKAGDSTYLIPFVEIVKIKNFTGTSGRNATYTTVAGIVRYSSWTASISQLKRDITTVNGVGSNGRHMQVSAGYKFTDNFTIDVSRSSVREDGNKGSLFGVMMSYMYKF